MNVRRLLLSSVGLGLAAMLASGIPIFLLGSGRGDAGEPAGPVDCPGATLYQCIPKLKVDDVVAALRGHGYRCINEHGYWECTLQFGAAELRATFDYEGGGISEVSARVAVPIATGGVAIDPGERSLAFLLWVASLPYADNAQSVGEIRAWITKQVAEKRNVEATIGRYKYVLDASKGGGVDLKIEAAED